MIVRSPELGRLYTGATAKTVILAIDRRVRIYSDAAVDLSADPSGSGISTAKALDGWPLAPNTQGPVYVHVPDGVNVVLGPWSL